MKIRAAIASTLATAALCGCGGAAKPTRQQLAERCGERAANSLSPGFGGPNRKALQAEASAAAREFYLLSGKCSVGG